MHEGSLMRRTTSTTTIGRLLVLLGEVAILWDNSKVEVCGFTGHDMDMSCIVKVRTPVNHLTLGLERRTHANVDWMRTYSKVTVNIGDGIPGVRKGRAKEVIDDLVCEHALERDWVLDDHNAQLWSREEDMCMDAKCRAEVDTLRKLVGVAVAAIAILLAFCMRWM
ncbi:hypothetical protein Cgig2_017464 [Carnegiea gigantea]|uniref:Uncharacterized protein n=1 Tax=Carnegiea gigantea TaxID=171969 RepID=A0A9Q1GYW2_9CARY|nr:hypothetical protein Cgig2_017464 [Carnegiea gigantea]